MKYNNRHEVQIITGDTAQEFQQRLNDAYIALGNTDVTTEWNHNQGFCAYLSYNVEEQIPETFEDRYYLEFHSYRYCCECEFLQMNDDRRKKWHYCEYHDERHSKDEYACEMFYRELLEGVRT